jgi:hypothetical protein
MFQPKDFTVTSKELSEALGVSAHALNTWTDEGAFPHIVIQRGAYKTRMFLKEALAIPYGELKTNRMNKVNITPMHILDGKTISSSNSTRLVDLQQSIERLMARVRKIELDCYGE